MVATNALVTSHTEDSHADHEDEHSWSEQAWPILVFLAPLCITGLVTNTAVIFIFCKWRALRDRINHYIVNLAISNLAICIVSPPLIALPIFLAHTAEDEEEELITDLSYRIAAYLFGLACYANCFATTAIALHRRRMIIKPKAQIKNEQAPTAICVIMWVTSLILALPELFRCATSAEDHVGETDKILPTLHNPYERFAIEVVRLLLQFVLASGLMFFSYFSVFIALRKRQVVRMRFKIDKNERKLSSLFQRPTPNRRQLHPTTHLAATVAASLSTSQNRWVSNDTVEYMLTASIPNDRPSSAQFNCTTQLSPDERTTKRQTSKRVAMKVWNSIRSNKFSASDSKNVCILVATIAVHFACWAPYNIVRCYVALVEAINDHEEPRAPMFEGILLCVAVCSVLHCPIFYIWLNRRNRHGLIAFCASVIPCRNSVLRQRLHDMVQQGNSVRHGLQVDKRRGSTVPLHARIRTAVMRRQRGGFLEDLRSILHRHHRPVSGEDDDEIPPARPNSIVTVISDEIESEGSRRDFIKELNSSVMLYPSAVSSSTGRLSATHDALLASFLNRIEIEPFNISPININPTTEEVVKREEVRNAMIELARKTSAAGIFTVNHKTSDAEPSPIEAIQTLFSSSDSPSESSLLMTSTHTKDINSDYSATNKTQKSCSYFAKRHSTRTCKQKNTNKLPNSITFTTKSPNLVDESVSLNLQSSVSCRFTQNKN